MNTLRLFFFLSFFGSSCTPSTSSENSALKVRYEKELSLDEQIDLSYKKFMEASNRLGKIENAQFLNQEIHQKLIAQAIKNMEEETNTLGTLLDKKGIDLYEFLKTKNQTGSTENPTPENLQNPEN